MSDANEIASEVQSSEIQTPAEAPDTDAIADAVPIVDAMSQTLAVAVATLPAENAQEAADLPDAAMADTDTGNASARAAESPEHAGSSAEGHGESTAAEVLDQPRALPNLDVAENSVTTDETRSRAKKTIDDRMKLMLNDLAKVTGRRSSYETVKELKPKRAGLATPRTVQDVVDQWQDPAQMIPWTCLQELGPGIFHKNAHKHMHLSMHELMDKVSSTKAVKHLSDWLPERVMTRALMEFPRVPHMMHCWNEEKRKYFDSRGVGAAEGYEAGVQVRG
ncbi:hypothetical protein PHBOTO_006696 [Pseudozyma hubeiensis]|nr:hypothetical protein PHBOTO_006696 [Pseudozyma hubeiensis]